MLSADNRPRVKGKIEMGIGRIAGRTMAVLEREGVWGTVIRVVKYLRVMAGFPPRDYVEYERRREEEARAYDGKLGLDTGGTRQMFDLTIDSANAVHAGPFIASSPEQFRNVMRALDIDPAGCTFVDLGAGKGRGLLLAAEYPFKAITGVEFAKELHAICQQNLARVGDPRITCEHGDAELFTYPEGDFVVYMNNPFDRPLVEKIARRLEVTVRENPRTMRLLYINPPETDLFEKAPWFHVGSSEGGEVFGQHLPG